MENSIHKCIVPNSIIPPQPPSLTTREEGVAFDSKFSSGLTVSHSLLCLLCLVFCSLVPQLCDQAVDQRCLTYLIFTSPSPLCFFKDNCVKNAGSVQEGVDFEDNSHNSLEPRGWWEYTLFSVCA